MCKFASYQIKIKQLLCRKVLTCMLSSFQETQLCKAWWDHTASKKEPRSTDYTSSVQLWFKLKLEWNFYVPDKKLLMEARLHGWILVDHKNSQWSQIGELEKEISAKVCLFEKRNIQSNLYLQDMHTNVWFVNTSCLYHLCFFWVIMSKHQPLIAIFFLNVI